MPLEPAIKDLARGKNFAAITTHLRNGDTATQIMWIDADDDHLIFNTEVGRAKYRAIEEDPRVTIAVWDAGNPYHYAEVRGTVAATDDSDAARAHIDQLAQKYQGTDYGNPIGTRRVIVKVAPERQRVQ
jgi:PPOX class probable F420-dependent enzyme